MHTRILVGVLAILMVIALAIGIGIGFVIFSRPSPSKQNVDSRKEVPGISEQIQRQIEAKNIRENLRYLTRVPHVAGTPADRDGAEYIRDLWLEQGLDSAKLKPYKVLLQYPSDKEGMENKVQIYNPHNGSADWEASGQENTFGEEELEQPGIPPPYNAYSGNGDVQADMLYVNYGMEEDFEYLAGIGVHFKGKIFIARYGRIGRSRKAMLAQRYGGVGLVLYSDPKDYSVPPGLGKPYPDGPWLPDTAVQRGGVLYGRGDPLTPHYPATENAFREKAEDVKHLPKIPVHPIANKDAAVLLSNLIPNSQIPDDWKGNLQIPYGLGPGFASQYQDRVGRIVVNSESSLRWTYNVVGFIKGEIEPDRYVIIGNHRDAWGLGAIDPTSGTASLMEITRVFGKLKNEGWRPRRTLVFCSWGAEEFGMIGSIEWTEEYYYLLAQRTVSYLNLDIAAHGSHVLMMTATPHIKPVVFEATKRVKDPFPTKYRRTVYDTMKERGPSDPDDREHPWIGPIGGSSDYYGFQFGLGVPCIHGSYMLDYFKYSVQFYPLYHTSYETFRLMEDYIDPEFKSHEAIARTYAEMLRMLGDARLLPLDIRMYATKLDSTWKQLATHEWYQLIENKGISLRFLESAVQNFSQAAQDFHSQIKDVDMYSALAVHAVNDQMMLLDRAFMMTVEHLPGQPWQRHILFAGHLNANRVDYPTGTFPGIYDIMYYILRRDPVNPEEQWLYLEKHVSILTYMIQSAAATLFEFTAWS